MNLFVDTSALYAVLDRNDRRHTDARATWRELLETGSRLFTTNYVQVELAALAQTRIGMDAVGTLSSDLLPVITTIWVDESIHRSAAHAHLASSRRSLSLVDCVSFEAMRRFNLREVFCFDPHFSQQGFAVVPG